MTHETLTQRPDIMTRLRADTDTFHKNVEGQMPLMNPDVTGGIYSSYVAAYSSFFGPLQEKIFKTPGLESALPDLRERRKAVAPVEVRASA